MIEIINKLRTHEKYEIIAKHAIKFFVEADLLKYLSFNSPAYTNQYLCYTYFEDCKSNFLI